MLCSWRHFILRFCAIHDRRPKAHMLTNPASKFKKVVRFATVLHIPLKTFPLKNSFHQFKLKGPKARMTSKLVFQLSSSALDSFVSFSHCKMFTLLFTEPACAKSNKGHSTMKWDHFISFFLCHYFHFFWLYFTL